MKRNVLIFGLVLGTILTANGIYMVNVVCNNPSFKGNDVLGYAAMIIVFSLTFFGIRNYRNKELQGAISFGRAFKAGSLIALVGASIYVGVWLVYYYLFVPDFIDKYAEHVMAVTPASELQSRTEMIKIYREMYKNPLFIALISYAEVLPVGLAVAFVSSLILRKKA